MALVPKVTGISPKEGPPRTKLTVRGENLGTDQNDLLSVKICDIECLIFSEWISPHKIITRSPHCVGSGSVIVTTQSGGVGTSTIQFRAFDQVVDLTTPCGVWVDESDLFLNDSRGQTISNFGTNLTDNSNNFSKKSLFSDGNHTSNNAYTDILSETFSPSHYLMEIYGNVSFEELKNVYKEQLEKRNTECDNALNSSTFLKANIVSIMECLNALNAFYLAFKKDRQEIGSDLTLKIDEYIRTANSNAHAIFDTIIARKDKSDSTRNALNVLQRYRFLFNLPSNIDKSIQRKDYDVVINDYFRAKNLFADSSVNVFRKVYFEVEQRIEVFSNMLLETFQNCCLSIEEKNIDELKKLIKHLSVLKAVPDPAWQSIQLIKGTLFDKVAACRQKYLGPSSKEEEQVAPTEPSELAQMPSQARFIEEISNLFSRIFIDLFKLGSAYLNGDLYQVITPEELKKKTAIFEKEIVIQSIAMICNEYRSVLLPDTIKSTYLINHQRSEPEPILVPWLPYCLRFVVNCYSSLVSLDFNSLHLQNPDVLKQMQTFIFDLRLYTMTSLFNQKSLELKDLAKKESWNIQLDDIYGVRTNLPLLFESKVIEILQLNRDSVIQIRGPDEIDIMTQINVQGLMKQLTQNLIYSFLQALEKSVMNPVGSANITPDNRCLVVLCNCFYTSNYVLPKLYETFDKYGYPDMSQIMQLTQRKFRELEEKLLDMYIEKKRDAVIGAIEPSMYLFDSNWTEVTEMPTDVSYYVKEIIQNLIFVQAEIYQISPHLVGKTMFDILQATVDEIERLYGSCISKISDAARVQILIDINAIDNVLRKTGTQYQTLLKPKIDSCRAICNSSVPDQTIRKLIEDVTNQFCHSMRLQISCFNFDNPIRV